MIRFFALSFLLWSSAANAQQIPVRSGEHGSFTRLVFDTRTDQPWTMAQDGTRVTIRFSGQTDGFATEQIFSRIDRRRVGALSQVASELAVDLACDCVATAFASGPTMVVLDISDVRQQKNRPPVTPSRERPAFAFGNTLTDTTALPDFVMRLRPYPETAELFPRTDNPSPPLPPLAPPNPRKVLVVPFELSDAPGQAAFEGAQARLSREIGVAATRGILRPTREGFAVAGNARPQIDPSGFGSRLLPQASEFGSGVGETVRVTTSMDFMETALPSELPTSPFGPGCIDPAIVDISAWADTRPMPAQVAEARAPLFGEFDTLDAQAAQRLGQLYLYFGFGPEAMRTFNLDPEPRQDLGLLLEMGEIMEFGHVRNPQLLKNYVECDSALALWGILSLREVPTSTVINARAALRTLNALPPHLRDVLSPELSQRLLAYGDRSGAATALRSVERLPGDVSDGTKLAQADLELSKKQIPQAQEKLAEVVNSNSAQSALALIKSVSAQIAQDQPVSAETALLVEAYAIELRDDDLGPELRKIHVLSLARSGQYDTALGAIKSLPKDQMAIEQAPLTDHVVTVLTAKASDMDFLEIVFGLETQNALSIADSTRASVAERLLALGFASEASTVIEGAAKPIPSNDVRLLKAAIALNLKRPALAQLHLLGLQGADADRLRAHALKLEGSLAEASVLFDAANEDAAAQTAAFLADDWQDRVTDDSPLGGPLARLSNTPLITNPSREGMLARSTEALTESGAARSYIEGLLSTPMTDTPQPET